MGVMSIASITGHRDEELQTASAVDLATSKLRELSDVEWSANEHGLPANLEPYSALCDEISTDDGILHTTYILKFPQSLRQQCLTMFHKCHLEPESFSTGQGWGMSLKNGFATEKLVRKSGTSNLRS